MIISEHLNNFEQGLMSNKKTEDTFDTSHPVYRDLVERVGKVDTRLCKTNLEKTSLYENALKEALQNEYPDKHWSEVTGCDIRTTLLESGNDIDKTARKIVESFKVQEKKPAVKKTTGVLAENMRKKSLKEGEEVEYRKKYYSSIKPDGTGEAEYWEVEEPAHSKDWHLGGRNKKVLDKGEWQRRQGMKSESLKESAEWKYTLSCSDDLESAIDGGDLEEVIEALKGAYDELVDQELFDEGRRDKVFSALEQIDVYDDGAEAKVEKKLDQFYNVCDKLGVKISFNESLDETWAEMRDGKPSFFYDNERDARQGAFWSRQGDTQYDMGNHTYEVKEVEGDPELEKALDRYNRTGRMRESLKEARQRTTKEVYVVQGNYGYGWDDLTYEDSYAEAKSQRKCYDENEPYPHRVITRREKIKPQDESIKEDTVKQGSSWVNKGKEGTHGKFKTKKGADAQRKAMFANGYKEGLKESEDSLMTRYYNPQGLKPWRGCKSIKFKWNGTQSDPDLIYKGYVFNYYDIEEALWDMFLEYNELTEKDVYDGYNVKPEFEAQFNDFVCEEAPSYCDDYIANGAPKNWHDRYRESVSRRKGKKLTEAPIYDLTPQYDSRQSFYSKAKVDTGDKGDKNRLYSYNTLVAEIKDGKPVVYGTYSATTLRHIKDWLRQNGFKADSAKQIMADYGKSKYDESFKAKCKKKNLKEDLSYGEMVTIESEWEKYKERQGIKGFADADVALAFIEEECAEVYPTQDEQDEIFTLIGCIEEDGEYDESLKEGKKINIYKNGDYAYSTNKFSRVKDAVADARKSGKVKVASIPDKEVEFSDEDKVTGKFVRESCKEKKDKKSLKEADDSIHIFVQEPPEDDWRDFEYHYGDSIGDLGIVICGNRDFREYGDDTLLQIVNGDYEDDDLWNEEEGYYEDYDVLQELEKVTGKKYEQGTLRGYSQGDWNYIYYPVELEKGTIGSGKHSTIDYIEAFYMGQYETFFDEEDEVEYYVPHFISWEGTGAIKQDLSEQSGVPVEQIKIRKFKGYTRTASYEQDESLKK